MQLSQNAAAWADRDSNVKSIAGQMSSHLMQEVGSACRSSQRRLLQMTEEAGEDRELEIDSSSSDHIAARMLRLERGGQEILRQRCGNTHPLPLPQ